MQEYKITEKQIEILSESLQEIQLINKIWDYADKLKSDYRDNADIILSFQGYNKEFRLDEVLTNVVLNELHRYKAKLEDGILNLITIIKEDTKDIKY